MTRRRAGAVVIAITLAAGTACGGDFERMQQQPRYHRYGESQIFADGKVMQPPLPGTIAADAEGGAAERIDLAAIQRGQERFDVYCAACHGVLGDGNTPVAAHMPLRQPPSLHEPRIRAFPRQQIYNVISNGYGLMPSYAPELTPRERWAVAAYVQALQRSQSTPLDDLPDGIQGEARAALGANPK